MAIIRPMVPRDYTLVAKLSNDAAERGLVGVPSWETAAEVSATVATHKQAEFVVAEDDEGHVVGFAGYVLTSEGQAVLYGPLVTTEGHGIGAWLGSRIETMARIHGANSYSMLIGLTNRSGAAWAEWRGYQLDSEYPETLLSWIYPGELKQEESAETGTVRRAAPEDLDRVEELYRACYQADIATRTDWASWLPTTFILEENGELQGILHVDLATATIRHLCMNPDTRRPGLGARLLAETLEALWRERRGKVGVAVPLDNQAVVSLIRRLGFRREIAVARWMKRDG